MNPDGILVFRDRNALHGGMQFDKVTMYLLMHDPRDYPHTRAIMKTDGKGLSTLKPRLTCFARNNIDDMHVGGGPVELQSHRDAVVRLRNSRFSIREDEWFFPDGVTCRTGPFSQHPVEIHKEFKESDMDFGETDTHDLPVLHQRHWAKFTFAVNRPDQNDTFHANDVDEVTNRFGNFGM